jgi:hypothetical protein
MKAYKICGFVLAPIALVLFPIVMIGIFGMGILIMHMTKSKRETRLGAWIWRRLEGIGWFWTNCMWIFVLFPFMWIRRRVHGKLPLLPPGTHRVTTGHHPTDIASLGSAFLTTVLDRTPVKIIGKKENKSHPINRFLLGAAELLGWMILIDRSIPGQARQTIAAAIRAISTSVNYVLYLDSHRFTKKRREKDIARFSDTIHRIQDFDQTLVPRSGGLWEILSKLREANIPIQVLDTSVFFDCEDLGISSMFHVFGSILHIEVRDISDKIATIQSEEELQVYLVELYREKNRRMREVRGIPHPI